MNKHLLDAKHFHLRMNTEDHERRAFYESQSFVVSRQSVGSLLTFNVDFGYLEAIVRGFRSGFLSEFHYRQLSQCESLDDVKLALGDTDYAGILSGVGTVTPDIIVDRCSGKFVQEFEHLRSQATGALATFLDFITFEYMISNITFLIGSLNKGGSPDVLLEKCEPLGRFPYMQSVLTYETGSTGGLSELYSTFLVDSPVARYFEAYFKGGQGDGRLEEIGQVFQEEPMEVLDLALKKLWLEDFYRFTQNLGGETAAVMKELLEFEADRKAISIMVNSFGTHLNDPPHRDDRQSLFPSLGKLYPEGLAQFSNVGDISSLLGALEAYPEYHEILEKSQREDIEVEDLLYKREVELNRLAFDGQGHFGCFWGFTRLKEQEKRNLFWITECIQQGLKDSELINRWIPAFPGLQ